MITYIPIEIISVILGALLGGWATYRLSIDIARRQAAYARSLAEYEHIRNASLALRSSFAPYLATIRRDEHKTAAEIQIILEHGVDSIAIEVEKFRFYVSSENLPAYDEACEEYQNIARIRAMNYFKGFDDKPPFEVFESKVDAIFHFTMP